MTTQPISPGETCTARRQRRSATHHVTRSVLWCLLSVGCGAALGQYLMRQQLQVHAGLVHQLQTEIHVLTDNVQRLEQLATVTSTQARETLRTLEHRQWTELSAQLRSTQERLLSLERQLDRQILATRTAQASCLAEFEPFRRRGLAIPVDVVAEALERMTQGRTNDLAGMRADVQTQLDHERLRLAELLGDWRVGTADMPGSAPREDLSTPDRLSPVGQPRVTRTATLLPSTTPTLTTPGPLTVSEESLWAPTPLSPPAATPLTDGSRPLVTPDSTARGELASALPADPDAGSLDAGSDEDPEFVVPRHAPAPPVTLPDLPKCQPMEGAPELIPIPDANLPPLGVEPAVTGTTPPARRGAPGHLSFASGRRVDTLVTPRELPPPAILQLPPRNNEEPVARRE